MDEKIQLKDRPLLPDNEIADTSFTHVAQGGRDYKAYVRNFKQKIENNLTTATTGSGLDATQGTELKRLNDFNQNANRILFYFTEAITKSTDIDQNVSIEIAAGLGAMPNKIPYSILAFSGTMPLNSVLKLQYYPEFNNFQWSIVNDPTTTNEGADSNIFYIAKNISGQIVTANGSFISAFWDTRSLPISDPSTESLDGYSITQQDINRGVTSSILSLQQAVSNLAGAFVSIDAENTPVQLTTTEYFLNIIQAIESTNPDIIEVDETANTITIKEAGIYNFATYLDISNVSNQDRTLTLRVRNNATNAIISERALIISESGYTGTSSPPAMEVTAEQVPLTIKLSLQSSNDTSLILNVLNTSLYSRTGGGIAGTTRNYVTPTVTAGVLTFDFDSKNECWANKSGGGAIAVASNITIAYSNATNFKTLWAVLNITGATRTVTFPSAHKSGDFSWSALALTLPVGEYEISVMFDGLYYRVTCSNAEV